MFNICVFRMSCYSPAGCSYPVWWLGQYHSRKFPNHDQVHQELDRHVFGHASSGIFACVFVSILYIWYNIICLFQVAVAKFSTKVSAVFHFENFAVNRDPDQLMKDVTQEQGHTHTPSAILFVLWVCWSVTLNNKRKWNIKLNNFLLCQL